MPNNDKIERIKTTTILLRGLIELARLVLTILGIIQ